MRRLALKAYNQYGRNIYTKLAPWRWPLSIVSVTLSVSMFPVLERMNYSGEVTSRSHVLENNASSNKETVNAVNAYVSKLKDLVSFTSRHTQTGRCENEVKVWDIFSILPLMSIIVHADSLEAHDTKHTETSREYRSSEKSNSVSKIRSYMTGFRTKVMGEYENKLRKHSSPQKVFEYFASANGQMTPEDLVRALTPFTSGQDESILGSRNFKYSLHRHSSVSPVVRRRYKEMCEKLNLDKKKPATDVERQLLWKFRQKYELPYEEHLDVLNELEINNEIFYGTDSLVTLVDLSGDGLISFPEFQVLMLLLLCKEKMVASFFSAVDENKNGFLNYEEFLLFLEKIQKQCFGKWKLKRWNTNTLGFQDRDGLELLRQRLYDNGTKLSITYDEFSSFVSKIRIHVQKLEFNQFDKDHDEYLTGYEFALYIIASHSSERFREQLLGRAEHLKTGSLNQISFEEFCEFGKFLQNIDVITGVIEERKDIPIPSNAFATITKSTANVQLSDTIVEVLFLLLDNQPQNIQLILESR
mmetsp:Transcript_393/g.533  ORF Transcript_393/g.533 Transcript_393/m.533 type:complete len:529 (+) Transcript_393:346-1932(+)